MITTGYIRKLEARIKDCEERIVLLEKTVKRIKCPICNGAMYECGWQIIQNKKHIKIKCKVCEYIETL